LVILSKASVESEWRKKELSTGLIRELDEKRGVVLPVLKQDCAIPLFLRDKLYADFRTNFDDGLRSVLESIARVTSESLLRVDAPEWHTDWAVDFGTLSLRLEDEKAQSMPIVVNDTKSTATFLVLVTSRRLGEDTGRDILLDLAGQLASLRAGQRDVNRQLTPAERERLRDIQARFERRHHRSSPIWTPR
jgi:hypothetical protein